MRERGLEHLSKEELHQLYQQETERLQQRLLEGVSWEETREERMKIARVSNILYKRSNPGYFSNPAEG